MPPVLHSLLLVVAVAVRYGLAVVVIHRVRVGDGAAKHGPHVAGYLQRLAFHVHRCARSGEELRSVIDLFLVFDLDGCRKRLAGGPGHRFLHLGYEVGRPFRQLVKALVRELQPVATLEYRREYQEQYAYEGYREESAYSERFLVLYYHLTPPPSRARPARTRAPPRPGASAC